MSDYISRQAAISICDNAIDLWNGQLGTGALVAVRDAIMALPSAQPEVIRCKDCKHWREGTSFSYCDKLHGMGVLDALDYMTAEDDYCSMAERREE